MNKTVRTIILGTAALLLLSFCGCSDQKKSGMENMTENTNNPTPTIEATATPTNTATPTPEYTDYFMAYFAGNDKDQENIFFAVSRDGLHWDSLNDGKPVLKSNLGTKGVRDPFIMRKQDGTYVILATDLCIATDGDWWKCQWNGSKSIVIWESEDLVTWSEPRLVYMYDKAGCVWAPEAFWDSEAGNYIVFWASRVVTDNYAYQRIYYSRTEDFVEFTAPEIWIDYNKDTIDTTVIKADDTYYRFTKYEGTSRIVLEKCSTLFGEWEKVNSLLLKNASGIEGPTAFALHPKDYVTNGNRTFTHVLMVDAYGGNGYYPILCDDLSTGSFQKTANYSMPGTIARHGTVLNITSEDYERLTNK